MLTYNDLKKGVQFVLEDQPYEVMEYEFLRMQQRKPVAKTKIKNLITGKILERNFHQNETFEEAELEREPLKYLYNHRGEFWFASPADPAKRFPMKEEIVGTPAKFLKPNTEVSAIKFRDEIITIAIPIKMELKVKEAPPNERGNTAQGGTKLATLETGVQVSVPLFVNTGDTIRVNTDMGTYVERVEKSKE